MSGPNSPVRSCPCCGSTRPSLALRAALRRILPTCRACHRVTAGEHQGKLVRVSPTSIAYWVEDEAFLKGTPGQRQLHLFAPPASSLQEGGES